tara:strand:- start:2084 stop:2281 length:198 start_codon:yes stop_codon:yes gene_type:complete
MKGKKNMKSSGGGTCGTCKSCGWIFAILILLIALIPGWLATTWAKWVLVVIGVLMIIQKKCKACC